MGGYDYETLWDVCTVAALGMPFDKAQWRKVTTLSGGEQKRVVLEALLRGPEEVLLLDEPDNYLDVPAKRWLEDQLIASPKTVLFVSHDRELLNRVATRVATLEPGGAGSTLWVHPGRFSTYQQAREDRNSRLEELRRRWDEEHQKIMDLVQMLKVKAKYNDGMAPRYHAAQTRLRKFEEAGPPQETPLRQNVNMRLKGGRTAKRAVIAEGLELSAGNRGGGPSDGCTGRRSLTGADEAVRPRDLVRRAGRGARQQRLRQVALPAARRAAAAATPTPSTGRSGTSSRPPVTHTGRLRLGSRVRPGWFAQTHEQPALVGRTLLEILHRGDEHRTGRPREEAARVLDRYGLARASEQTFDSLSGGQQARFQILLLELSGATCLLLDEPTDNLDLHSAEALEEGLEAFEGTVIAVTHDRWFARGFDRFLVFGADGRVYESDEPVWDEGRVVRAR